MSRSKWKGLYCNNNLLNNFIEFKDKKKKRDKKFKTRDRSSVIDQSFLGSKFSIYNGKNFINVFIDQNKIGYKLGEFSFTRKKCIHKKKIKK